MSKKSETEGKTHLTDYEIAKSVKMLPIEAVAEKLGLTRNEIIPYGNYKAKIDLHTRDSREAKAKLVLVTAMTPTPAGEGKTTVAIGLTDGLNLIGKKALITLREPSLGPVFGIKGGAAGGGYSQVVPMDDINLHFTGDIHAIAAAHNLLAALLDNQYSQKFSEYVCLQPNLIKWNRTLDMNDRSLRQVIIGLSDEGGQVRDSSFEITAASEVMAITGLSYDLIDLKDRLGKIIIAINNQDKPMRASEIQAQGAMAVILKDAIKPNLVQTLAGNPAFIHTGPFANIAHGTSSIIATDLARRMADIVVIEAGFGSELGGEKFFNLVSRQNHMVPPSVVVIVATVRAIKHQGGQNLKDIAVPNPIALVKGFSNLEKHIENMKSFNRPVIVAINSFASDSKEEISLLKQLIQTAKAKPVFANVWGEGGNGAVELAEAVWEAANTDLGDVKYTYDLKDSIEVKIEKVATSMYGAAGVVIPRKVRREIEQITSWGFGEVPICMAKTQNSLSDDPSIKGRPDGDLTEIRDIKANGGANFVVVYAGDIMTMPGLPKNPAALSMDIDINENITGLF